jgi:pSer/pThr/pTyr-binding forkhead associated (FHA) protein
MPAEPSQSHLLIIEDDKGRRGVVLERSSYSIGRDPKCDIRLVSQFVSRHHATLIQLPISDGSYQYQIVDGDLKGKPSANGLLINGRRLRTHTLQDKDVVVFGPQVKITYQLLKRDPAPTEPPDEFDITLISPNMVDDPDSSEEWEAADDFPDLPEEYDARPPAHRCDLVGKRRWFLNFQRHGSLKPKDASNRARDD